MLQQFEQIPSQNESSSDSSSSESVHQISQDLGVDGSTISDLSLRYDELPFKGLIQDALKSRSTVKLWTPSVVVKEAPTLYKLERLS